MKIIVRVLKQKYQIDAFCFTNEFAQFLIVPIYFYSFVFKNVDYKTWSGIVILAA